MAAYHPLRKPGTRTAIYTLDASRDQAKKVLADQQAANIHDPDAILRAAVHLEITLRELVASLDAQDGES